MTIAEELSKPEYQTGSYQERLALLRSKTVSTVGRIEQGALKNLEAIIAAGLWRDKMVALKESAVATLADPASTPEEKQLANVKLQVVAGFHEAISEAKLANKAPAEAGGHSVNMADPKVSQTFGAAQMAGIQLVSASEVTQVMNLATYQKPMFPDATLKDVIAHFEPALLDGQWHEIYETSAPTLFVRLAELPPEQTYILVQMQDQYGDGTTSEWYHATALHGLNVLKEWTVRVPNNGYTRKIRWKCDYVLNGATVGVR